MSQAIHGAVGSHHGLGEAFVERARGAWHAIRREAAIRHDLHALASLDDAGLADLGISRGGAEDAVRHGRPRLAHTGRSPSACPRALSADVAVEWR